MKLKSSFESFGGDKGVIEGRFIGLNERICVNQNPKVVWASRN